MLLFWRVTAMLTLTYYINYSENPEQVLSNIFLKSSNFTRPEEITWNSGDFGEDEMSLISFINT